jgi:hypothetical protein
MTSTLHTAATWCVAVLLTVAFRASDGVRLVVWSRAAKCPGVLEQRLDSASSNVYSSRTTFAAVAQEWVAHLEELVEVGRRSPSRAHTGPGWKTEVSRQTSRAAVMVSWPPVTATPALIGLWRVIRVEARHLAQMLMCSAYSQFPDRHHHRDNGQHRPDHPQQSRQRRQMLHADQHHQRPARPLPVSPDSRLSHLTTAPFPGAHAHPSCR